MHPISDSLFVYGMSKGSLKLGDLRQSAHLNNGGVTFGEVPNHKNYIYELLANYTDVSFLRNGKYIATRDCLTVKLWDVCNAKKPINTIMLNDGIKSKLCEMV